MPAVLLHVCCGPCAIMPAQILSRQGYEVILWYMNPNIHPLTEYLRRREAASECAQRLRLPIMFDDFWDIAFWLKNQVSHPEAPDRCHWCIEQRLLAACDKAAELGADYFSTSLLYSPYQPHEYIASKGSALTQRSGPRFIYQDFRPHWREGVDTAIKWNIYRQAYCGCIFSEAERYAKKLARAAKS